VIDQRESRHGRRPVAADLATAVYTPDPQIRKPGRLAREMIRDVAASRELAWRICARNITTQYRQTALGYVWAVIPPVVTSLVFILLDSSKLLRTGEIGIPYPVYVLIGTVSFGLFLDALNAPLAAVGGWRGMLVKINFPREALLLAAVGQVLFSFSVKLALVAAVLLGFQVPVHPTAALAVIPLAGLLMMGVALGVLLIPIGALFQDVVQGLVLVGSGLVFLTPAAYPPPGQGLLGVLTACNPLTPLIMAARDLVVLGSSRYMAAVVVIVLVTPVVLLLAWVVFRLAMPILIERMGS
jgi:lipopolysaccharide transport system permease protein